MELNKALKNLRPSLIRMLAEEGKKYDNVISLAIGDPDIPTPRGLVKEALKFAEEQHFGYATTALVEKSGTVAADFYNKTYNTNFTSGNILFNIGSSEALTSSIRTITNPGDEIIMFAPFYPGYCSIIELASGVPVVVDITENDFKITPQLIEKYLTPKTKAIIFCNPCNPTGLVLSYDEIKSICDFLKDKDLFIIADEIYCMINFSGFTSFVQFPEILDKLIVINSFSKSHSMTGWRNGYSIVPKELKQYFSSTSSSTIATPATLSLVAGNIALEKYSDVSETAAIYKERAKVVTEALTKLGYKVIDSQGAFYLFADYRSISKKDSLAFALELVKQVQVSVVPGIAFGTEGYIRISLTVSNEKLLEAVERMSNYKDV